MSLFFILSGFILAYQYTDRSVLKYTFYVSRFARIYPIYIVAALAALPWLGIEMEFSSLYEFIRQFIRLAFLIVVNIFITQAWFPQFFSYWNDGGSWSISVEAFCYAVFPFILPRLKEISKKYLIWTVLILYAFAILPGLSIKLFPTTVPAPVFYAIPIFRFPEFLIGIACYLLITAGVDFTKYKKYQFWFIAAFVCYIGVFGSKMLLYIGHNWIALPFFSFMILTLFNGRSILNYVLSAPISVWFGKISYCFYSFQAVLILPLIDNYEKIVMNFSFLSNNIVLTFVVFVFLTVFSAVGYYFIEKPAREWIRASCSPEKPILMQIIRGGSQNSDREVVIH
ncbi:Acyltransferase family protein [Candidatus Bealeia paramacronuclearis]|uniref:Acyltransferase family protein n=2 Tax=Candidatus Bealeia paramacronuclearis TaxID=1921001 RepID=A0ABZ2C550_9PROT|nr:Acyltransferase family protein [Candidatus Bealeia paramacronuclearis]